MNLIEMTIISTTVGKNPLKIMEQPSQSNKRFQNAVLGCRLKYDRMISSFPRQTFNIRVIQVYALTSNAEEAEVQWFYDDLQDLLELIPPQNVLFIIGDWNAKVGSQKMLGVTASLALECKMKQGKGEQNFSKKRHWSQQTLFSSNTGNNSIHEPHQMVNYKNRLIIFFAAENGKALYIHQKQDWELTVTEMMNFLLQNSCLN